MSNEHEKRYDALSKWLSENPASTLRDDRSFIAGWREALAQTTPTALDVSVPDDARDAAHLKALLVNLTALVRGECPALLDDTRGGDSYLSAEIDAAIAAAPSPKETK